MPKTSLGYHTFTICRSLTQEEIDLIFKKFKDYMAKTKELSFIAPQKYSKDPSGRHYTIVYPNEQKGLTWKFRFSYRGFGDKTCSLKATINPKIMIGEKSYIEAANESYLNEIIKVFNYEAMKIAPEIGNFFQFSLNRIDYCINFNVFDLRVVCENGQQRKLPQIIMALLKRGDIPERFKLEYNNPYQFYLKSDSIAINCYWKYDDLVNNFYDCKDLNKSYSIIRFEVQYKYPKVYTAKRKIISEADSQSDETLEKLDQVLAIEKMLSDEMCLSTIKYYFFKTIKKGSYYTFNTAKRIIESKVSKWEKVERLTNTLKLITECGSIAKAKESFKYRPAAKEEFRRSLRELSELGINPVTIPAELEAEGLSYVQNLFDHYYEISSCAKAQKKQESICQK